MLVGCTKKENPPPELPTPNPPQPNQTEPPKQPEITTPETCDELDGFECKIDEDCPGEWLDASDTFSCCSVECNSTKLEIPPFEPTPEDEDLGDLT